MKESVAIILINPEGQILAVSRKDNHEDFALVGGKVDPEDYLQPNPLYYAAIRETKEETGLDITNLRLVLAMHENDPNGYFCHTYLADYSGEISHDPEHENHVVKWTEFSTILDGSFGEWNKLVAKSLTNMGVKFVKYKKPTAQYLFGIETNGDFDTPMIVISSKKYWDKNKHIPDQYENFEWDDISTMVNDSPYTLPELMESTFEIYKGRKLLTDTKEIQEAMVSMGFVFSQEIQDFLVEINSNGGYSVY